MPRLLSNSPSDKGSQVESLVADVFRQRGWRVVRQPRGDKRKPDLIVEHADKKYAVEIKRSSEGRRDRVIPLLAQAILEVRSLVRHVSDSPIGVALVVGKYLPESLAEQVKHFAQEHAPDIAVGILDVEGFRFFVGHGLERLNSERSAWQSLSFRRGGPAFPQLFSDLNQWMLKVILAPSIPESCLSAPRLRYAGASQLAKAAGVSVMSAFRFIDEFSKEGFLEQKRAGLCLVRREELMDRWVAANRKKVSEFPVRWILPKGKDAFHEVLRSYVLAERASSRKFRKLNRENLSVQQPRICLGLFSAAEALDVGFVHAAPSYLYMERTEPNILEDLGLSIKGAEQQPDLYVRIPRNRESVFRGVVLKDGVPVCDILQVWLDVAHHPARGKEQADFIWRRVLAPALIDRAEQ